MGHAPDQDKLDVQSAGDGEQIVMPEHQPPGLSYTIKDQKSFTKFIEDLRGILAAHGHPEDICDRYDYEDPNVPRTRKHPLLAKPSAEQPARWIHIKLQVVEGEESSSSATLLMRDDNVDVIGFINQSGVCYDFTDRKRMLPQEYKSVLLGWGNSYKSILGVTKEDEVMDRLKSANLGKTFATHAVGLLSRFDPNVVADVYNLRLALVGLMFMVSESARLNPVRDAIADGWDTGKGFTKQLMTDHVRRYVEMSRRLRHLKTGDYAERRPDSKLLDIYLVLNVHAELLYTIGDEISFISFMKDLRRKLAEHPNSEDILGGHKDTNLSKTRDHPVLPKQRADEQPARWIHVTLQAVEGEETSWTTLFMRDDNLYVHGFMNQQGDSFQLVDDNRNAATSILLPVTNGCDPELTRWGVSYMSMLGAKSNDHAVHKLEAAHLGRDFAKKAVRVLSSYRPNQVPGNEDLRPGVALAGLIVMVCESARMNPPHDSVARGWSTGTGFAKQLITEYVWEHGNMSRKLMAWKTRDYASNMSKQNWQPHPIMELQTIYLVLNTHTRDQVRKEENKKSQNGKPGNAANNGDSSNKPGGSNDGGGGPPRQSKVGHNAGSGGHGCKSGNNNDTNAGQRQSQHKKACNVGSSGSPASKSEEARDADSCGGPASQPDHAGDDTGSSGGGSASQPREAGDAGSSGGCASQPGEAGDTSPSQGNNGSQPGELDVRSQGNGRPRVELLAIRADLRVKDTEIIVFDGRRGQIIYRKEEVGQGEQGMVDLVLTGPYKGISAYGCFAISIVPALAAAPGSRSGDAGGNLRWEWDCYDPEYAAQVDEPPVRHTIHTPDGCREVAEITYAVMSNALEASVEVLLRLQDGQSPGGVYGEITAYIGDFPDGSVLFRRTQGSHQLCSPSPNNDGWWCLELARNLVAVPCGKLLHIKVYLHLETSNIHLNNVILDIDNGVSSPPSLDVEGNKVKVNITWYPEIPRPRDTPEQIMTSKEAHEEKSITAPSSEKQIISGTPEVKLVPGHPTVVYTIGDELSFTEFIVGLRRILADHPDREDVLDRHKSSILSSTGEHPVLAKQRAEHPARWIHVKLQAVEGEEMLSTTLLMRDDNMYICGFMNQHGDSFELIDSQNTSADILPVINGYKPRRLSWGVSYKSLLEAGTSFAVMEMLAGVSMSRDFAIDAVQVLSHFPAWVDRMNPRIALAGLIVIVCESARMNPIHNFIERSWSDNNIKFTENEMRYVLKYGRMSHELLTWKGKGYTTNRNPIKPKQDIYLVLNCRLDPPEDWLFMDLGRPRVELLAIRADLGVLGTTVIVFDGKRGHIIYRKEEQEEKGKMVDLVLTGPCTSISAYGCFAIKIDIPAEDAGSSKGDASGSIKWEWDCYDPEYAKEVDQGPMTRTISSSGPGRNVAVTYAVMSNAVEATVQVKLRMKDGNSPCSVHGDITACIIGDFEHPSILFSRTKKTAQDFSPMTDSPQVVLYQLVRSLKLDRNVVAVPCGRPLYIKVDLRIETSKNQGGASINPCFLLSFYNNRRWSSQRREVDGCEVEVIVAWSLYPSSDEYFTGRREENKRMREANISYMVGNDADGFSRFITELRSFVADHPRCRDLMADHPDLSSTRDHKVLRKGKHRIQPENLFHIKLEAEAEEGVEETSSIILVMRYDNLDVIGFIINLQDRPSCYRTVGFRWELLGGYNSTFLDWDKYYGREQTDDILGPARLGKTFAAEAVRELSRFKNREPSEEAKRSLVGLMIMVCDSARMEPVREAIAGGWVNGTELTKQLNNYNKRNWKVISGALLDWRDHAYQGWPQNTELKSIGIKSSDKALEVVSLVFNDRNRICPTRF